MNSNSNFLSLFENSPLPMWVFDTQTLKFLEVNVAAVEVYGYAKTEFLSMDINDIRLPEDKHEISEIVKRNLKSGKFFKNVFRHLKKNGDIISVEVKSNSVEFAGKSARLVLAQDITEKLITDHRLAISEQRFKSLVQEGSELIAIIDIDLNYKYVSPTSIRILGFTPESFLGRTALEFIHEDDKDIALDEMDKLKEEHQVQLSPFRFRHQNGEWRWIESRVTNLLNDKAIQGIVCNSQDVTERVENEKKILENIERYNIVAKATQDAIWDYDLRSQVVVWNSGLKGILKYKKIGLTTDANWWAERVHPDDRERAVKGINGHLHSGTKNWKLEYQFLCGDGIYRFVLDRGYVVFDENGEPYRMIGAMQNITPHKMYMKSIEEQNVKLKEIAWLQSHAVRGPLTKIMSLVDLLKDAPKEEEALLLLEYLSQSSLELNEAIIKISKNANHTKLP